jgi:hypothetical protein
MLLNSVANGIFFATNEAKIKILLDIAVLQQQYQATFQKKMLIAK